VDERPVNSNERAPQMRIGLFAVAATLILAGIGAWVGSTTHARVEAAIEDRRIDPFQIMLNARDLPDLPVEQYDAV
jgi:hypothetical protein